jgi:hypothetical protein
VAEILGTDKRLRSIVKAPSGQAFARRWEKGRRNRRGLCSTDVLRDDRVTGRGPAVGHRTLQIVVGSSWVSSFLSALPPTIPDISVILPDSGRCELAVRQRFVGRTDSGVAALDQESPDTAHHPPHRRVNTTRVVWDNPPFTSPPCISASSSVGSWLTTPS